MSENTESFNGRTELVVPQRTFGEILQSMRLRQDMTLEDASKISGISVLCIECLESNNLTSIDKSPDYVEGLLEQLTECYHEDFHELREAYLNYVAEHQSHGISQTWTESDLGNEYIGDSHSKIITWILAGAVILIIAIILAGLYVSKTQRKKMGQQAPQLELPTLIEPVELPLVPLDIPQS